MVQKFLIYLLVFVYFFVFCSQNIQIERYCLNIFFEYSLTKFKISNVENKIRRKA